MMRFKLAKGVDQRHLLDLGFKNTHATDVYFYDLDILIDEEEAEDDLRSAIIVNPVGAEYTDGDVIVNVTLEATWDINEGFTAEIEIDLNPVFELVRRGIIVPVDYDREVFESNYSRR